MFQVPEPDRRCPGLLQGGSRGGSRRTSLEAARQTLEPVTEGRPSAPFPRDCGRPTTLKVHDLCGNVKTGSL